MKRIVFAALFLVSSTAFAEASFDQVERLIEQRNYTVAELALEEIIKNHPGSAHAFYAMAQAQAGKGNLEKAGRALDKAQALDPSLKFASSSNVESLRQAITPQTNKIEYVDDSHAIRNTFLLVLFTAAVIGLVLWYENNKKKKRWEEDDDFSYAYRGTSPKAPVSPVGASVRPTYTGTDRPTTNAYARPSYQPPLGGTQSTPTIINNNTHGGSGDFLTGMLVGDMLSSRHEHTTIIEREVHTPIDPSWDDDLSRIKELAQPSSAISSSWDSDSSASRSSSWDDDSGISLSWDSSSSSKKDDSWDSGSSSSSDSSWDSGSSSSSDSSWDSGSSSSSDSSW